MVSKQHPIQSEEEDQRELTFFSIDCDSQLENNPSEIYRMQSESVIHRVNTVSLGHCACVLVAEDQTIRLEQRGFGHFQ